MPELNPLDPEIAQLVEEWNRCTLHKDVPAAARLRDDDYVCTLASGEVLTREAELAGLASPAVSVRSIATRSLRTHRDGDRASVVTSAAASMVANGTRFDYDYQLKIEFRRAGAEWRATSARYTDREPDLSRPKPRPLARRAASWLKRRLRPAVPPPPTFQELAYLPYQPGKNFVLAPRPERSRADELPIPPRELWLGYNYPAHGELHVRTMLELAYASGLSFDSGDRILDLGCGAGRMIRHLRELADTCEIWGMDISSEHIYWCEENLSPPFHFATNTKVPHLPFEDRSFRFIYCGSLFTHIDDLANAWLLELHRILSPDGRLYVTIHDDSTIRLFERADYEGSPLVRQMRAQELFQRSKDSFGMISIGRDERSQVFYDAGYFARRAGSIFEVMSVTPEAYFYQTAYLLRRKQK